MPGRFFCRVLVTSSGPFEDWRHTRLVSLLWQYRSADDAGVVLACGCQAPDSLGCLSKAGRFKHSSDLPLPYIFYSGLAEFLDPLVVRAGMNQGLPGLGKSLLFTGIILAWSGLMTRWRLRLQL